jgi:hypothetical protein
MRRTALGNPLPHYEVDAVGIDLATMQDRRLTRLDDSGTITTFDITPDGKRIVFDRLRDHSDIVLIDLADN